MALGPVTPPPELLPGMPPERRAPVTGIDLDKPLAFGSIPAILGAGKEVPQFDQRASEDVTVDNLTRALFLGNNRYKVGHVTLDADEYNRIVRSPKGFQNHLGSISIASSDKKLITDADKVARKELDDTLEGLTEKAQTQKRVAAALLNEITNLNELLTCIRNPERALMKGADLLSLAGLVRGQYFARIVRVAGRARQWDQKRVITANNALDYKLTYGPQSQRVQSWREMVSLGVQYATGRHEVFEARTEALRERYRQVTRDYNVAHGLVPTAPDSSSVVPEVQ